MLKITFDEFNYNYIYKICFSFKAKTNESEYNILREINF